ncbi:MAG: hypothetical protein V4677_12980 [Bacteroidota bacterium]
MKKYLIVFYAIFLYLSLNAQNHFNISVIYKKIDSIVQVKNYFTSDIVTNKTLFDYNFLNGKFKNNGKQKCKAYYNKKGVLKKIEWVDVIVNTSTVDISFYPVKISQDFMFYLIQITNKKTVNFTMNRGFILHNIKDNQLFHISIHNEIKPGIKSSNYIEGISLLDSNLYGRKYIQSASVPPYLVESNGYLLYDDNNYMTFHSNAKNLSIKIDDNLYNLNKLFNFNKDLGKVKLNHYDKTKVTSLPFFHPYFLYGFSPMDYHRY